VTAVPKAGRHGHLWSLPDGTGLHAPPGLLVVDAGSGKLSCHLCGDWFAALGIHVRAHGHTAGSYRAAMSLPQGTVLAVRPARRGGGAGHARAPRAADTDRLSGAVETPAVGPGAAAFDVAARARAGDAGDDGPGERRSEGWTIIIRAMAEGAAPGRRPCVLACAAGVGAVTPAEESPAAAIPSMRAGPSGV